MADEPKGILARLLTETWPAKAAGGILDALMLPGQVYGGILNVPPSKPGVWSDEDEAKSQLTRDTMMNRASDLGGLMMLGATAAPAMQNATGMGIRAYHGSPHDFDKFSLSKIGTGEGAQAYGHGLYFAENPAVAQSYRLMNAPPGQGPIPGQLAMRALDEAKRAGLSGDEARKFAVNWLSAEAPKVNAHSPQHYYDAINNFDPLTTGKGAPGKMYEVDIKARPDQFLDWDAPLSKQPGAVSGALRDLGFKADTQGLRAFDDALLNALTGSGPTTLPKQPMDLLGQEIYRRTGRETYPIRADKNSPWEGSGARTYDDALAMVGGDKSRVNRLRGWSAAEAADVMREAGVPGIKYLDQGSRGAGSGSSNYVVFDDKLIDILRKYGLAGGAVTGAGIVGQDPAQAAP